MRELIAAVGFVLVLGMTSFVVLTLFTFRSLRRRNEVSRAHRTRPPLRWLVMPGPCAALHRRLRDSVLVLRAAVPHEKRRRRHDDRSPLSRLADEIEQQAASLELDLQLVAQLHGPARSAVRQRVAGQVLQLESLAHRVATAATAAHPLRPGTMPTDAALARVTEELDALEAARDELARLELDLGLTLPLP